MLAELVEHVARGTAPVVPTHPLIEYRLMIHKGPGSLGMQIGRTADGRVTVLGFRTVAADDGGDAAGRGPAERLGVVHANEAVRSLSRRTGS